MKKILIVEDDEAISEALKTTLEFEGYQVQSLLKAEHALEQVKSFAPDLMLLDLLLSGVDGTDIAKSVRKDPTFKKVPIIMFSAHPNAEKSALQAGVNDFIPKPFDIEDLLKKVKKYI